MPDFKQYINCTFEGVYLGAEPVMRDGVQVATRDKGEGLNRLSLRTGEASREKVLSITVTDTTLDQAIEAEPRLNPGEYVRIPGSLSVEQRGEKVFVSQWGNYIYTAHAAPAAATPTAPAVKASPVAVK